MFPAFNTLDRLYADVLDSVDRVRSEIDRLYYPPFGMTSGAFPPALGPAGALSPPALRSGSSGPMPLALPGAGRAGGGSMMPYYRGGMGGAMDMMMSPFYNPAPFGAGSMMPFSRGSATFVPRVDFQDCGNEYLLQADVPGIDKNNVKIQVHNGMLHIHGEQQQESKEQQQGYYMQERYQTAFSRSLPLPDNVREDDIRATMKDGVLQVHLPKVAAEKPEVKKIHIE